MLTTTPCRTSSLPERASESQIRQNGFLPSWEQFSHNADIGLVGLGPTKAEAFRQAAIALTAVVTEPGRVNTVTSIDVVCHADNDDLANWPRLLCRF